MTIDERLERIAQLQEEAHTRAEERYAALDKRLDRLTERHEALAQSAELIVKAQLEHEKRHAWVVDTLVRIEGNILDNELQLRELKEQVAATVDRYIRARGNGPNGPQP